MKKRLWIIFAINGGLVGAIQGVGELRSETSTLGAVQTGTTGIKKRVSSKN